MLDKLFWSFLKSRQLTVPLALSFQNLSESYLKKQHGQKSPKGAALLQEALHQPWVLGNGLGGWSYWSPMVNQGFGERIQCLAVMSFSSFFFFPFLTGNWAEMEKKSLYNVQQKAKWFFFLFNQAEQNEQNPCGSIRLTLSKAINIYSSITCCFPVGAFQAPSCISALQGC